MRYEQIWAPWRLSYVQKSEDEPDAVSENIEMLPGADPDCFLCRCAADWKNPGRLVVRHTPQSITVLNRYPYNNGHLLVAPLAHRGRLDDFTPEAHAALAQEITRMVVLLESVIHAEGFNVGLNLGRVAGAGLPGHLHWHVVPRWNGDTSFMPTAAGVNVIPQSLEALREALAAELAKQPPA